MATRNTARLVSVIAQGDTPKLSKEQKAFNSLVKQIEQQRISLRAWEQLNISYQTKVVEELLPLGRRYAELQVKMVHSLDQAWGQKGLNKSEKRAISDLITAIAGRVLSENGDGADLKKIYNKHSNSDFDTEAAAELDNMKVLAEMLFGIEADDDAVTSPDDLAQRVHEKFEREEAEAAEAAAREEDRRAKRKKSPRQLAAEARARTEQAELSQSIREVYRKLVVALHPDREPDPQERERKTELMQRVNLAYNQKNLLQLLELQLELEHIDQNDINNISQDRLKRYIKILKEQLRELSDEIIDIEHSFRFRLEMEPFSPISPDLVTRNLNRDIAGLRRDIREIEKDLRVFADIKILKMWLKDIKRVRRASRFDDIPF